jgi:hypothetical protein
MILRSGAYGLYEIYDIGNNAILTAVQLGQVGTDWQFVGLRPFYGSDTSDMLLRSASTGGFEVYDISNNQITGAAFLGTVGMDWQVMGFGNFSSRGESDMIMRNVNNGGVEVYDIANNQITGAAFMGTVGLNWQFSGVGNFSGLGESDMLLRNANTGGLEVYDIANNQITGAAFIGTIGLDWQFSGVGNFSGVPGESDLLLRNVNTGGLEVYSDYDDLRAAANDRAAFDAFRRRCKLVEGKLDGTHVHSTAYLPPGYCERLKAAFEKVLAERIYAEPASPTPDMIIEYKGSQFRTTGRQLARGARMEATCQDDGALRVSAPRKRP